ncbi:radical SAM protein [bacterium]|nr:radical SAM protein [bacterium]
MGLKVFLGNGPWLVEGYYGVRAGSRWPHLEEDGNQYLPFPFYLAYAAAMLEDKGHKTLTVDGVAERIQEDAYVQRATEFIPDVCILEASVASLPMDLRQAQKIKAVCPDSKIIFCGIHVDMYRPEFIDENPVVDFVLKGEYDLVAGKLIDVMDAKGDYSTIPNLVYRDPDGVARETENGEIIMDLDSLPWPLRRDLPMHNYWDLPGGIPDPSLQLWASRGCPFKCIFCAWPQIMYGNNKYRTRDPKDIVDEIEWCVKEYGFKSFYFDDDTFNIGKKRIMAFCDELNKRQIGLPWAAMSRADTSDPETFKAMKDSGLMAIKFGVESGSQQLVDNAEKNLDLKKVEQAVTVCHDLGINVHLTFSFGLPGESWETVRKTINFAKHLDPETLQFSIMTPFPGSSFYKMQEEAGKLLTKDWSQYDGGTTSVVRTDELSGADLEKALQMAYNEWDWHKTLRPLRDFHHFKRLMKRPRHSWHTFKFLAKRHIRRIMHAGA